MPQKMIQSIYHFHSKEGINMNKIYKVIWSKAKHTYVVASEIAKGHTKGETTGRGLKKLAAAMLVAAALLSPNFAWAEGTVTVNDTKGNQQTVYTEEGAKNHFATIGNLSTVSTEVQTQATEINTNTTNINGLTTRVNALESSKTDTALHISSSGDLIVGTKENQTVKDMEIRGKLTSGSISTGGITSTGDVTVAGKMAAEGVTDETTKDGTYIKQNNTVGNNLVSLDTQVKANADAINEEARKRKYSVTNLEKADAAEAATREAKDNELNERITNEANAIHDEIKAGDKVLDDRITNVKEYLEKQTSDNYVSKDDAAVQDGAIVKAANTIGDNVTKLDAALAKETAARIGADKAQDAVIQQVNQNAANGIATLATAYNNEVASREAADNELNERITNEANAIHETTNKLQDDLNTETTAREAADTALDTRITNVKEYLEKQTSDKYVSKDDATVQDGAIVKADKTIGENVTNLDAALAKETAARIGADKAQDKVIEQVNQNMANGFNTINTNMANGFAALNAADAAEKEARIGADKKLAEAVNSGLSLRDDNVLQKNTTTVADDGTVTTSKSDANEMILNKGNKNQITLNEKGVKVGTNSSVMDADGIYTGGDTFDAAKAAMSSDGQIKGANGKFTVDASGNTTVTSLDAGTGTIQTKGDIYAKDATFSGDITAKDATLSGDLSAKDGTFSGDLSAKDGTFSGDVSAKDVTATGTLQGAEVTDGTATMQNGNITGVKNLSAETITTSGDATIGGDLTVKGKLNVDEIDLTKSGIVGDNNVTASTKVAAGEITGYKKATSTKDGSEKESAINYNENSTSTWAKATDADGNWNKSTLTVEGSDVTSKVIDSDKNSNTSTQTASESNSTITGTADGKSYKSYITQNLKNILQGIKEGTNESIVDQTETGIKSTATDGKNTASTNLSNKGFNTYATDGTNKTYTLQTAESLTSQIGDDGKVKSVMNADGITNNADGGTITNNAKDLVNKATGDMTNTVGGKLLNDVTGDMENKVGGNLSTTVGGSQTTTVTGDSSLTAENITNEAKNKITNKAIDVETDAASSIVNKVSNDYGSNTSTQLSYETKEEMSQADGKTASYLRGAAEEKSQLIDGSKKTTIDTVAGQTNTNITEGTNVSNSLQKADQIASSVTDGTNTTVVNQDAKSLASSIIDGAKANNTSSTVDASVQRIQTDDTHYSVSSKSASKMEDALFNSSTVIDSLKDAEKGLVSTAVTDGATITGISQNAKDINLSAAGGTIASGAKNISNTAAEKLSNSAADIENKASKSILNQVGENTSWKMTDGTVLESIKGADGQTNTITDTADSTVQNVKNGSNELTSTTSSTNADLTINNGSSAYTKVNTATGNKETVKEGENLASTNLTKDGFNVYAKDENGHNTIINNASGTTQTIQTDDEHLNVTTKTVGSSEEKLTSGSSVIDVLKSFDDNGNPAATSSVTDGTNTSEVKQTASEVAASAKDISNTATDKIISQIGDGSAVKSEMTADGITNITGDNTVTSNTNGTTFENTNKKDTVTFMDEEKSVDTKKTTISGNTITTGEAVMDYADVMKDLGVRGNAAVDGNTTLGKKDAETTLTVNSTSTFYKDVIMKENATVEKNLTVEGDTSLKNTKVDGTLNVTGKATFNDIVTMSKGLSVTGGVTADTVTAGTVTAGTVTADSYKVGDKTYIDKDGINANNQVIRNVGQGDISAGSTDAVSGGQLYETNTRVTGLETRMGTVETRVDKLDNKIDKVGANAAAMANLHPLEFDEDSKWNIAAAVGSSGSETASAVGVFYRPNENVMVNASAAMGTGENMFGGGVSLRLGHGGNKAKEAQMKAAAAENKELRAKVDDLTARMDALLSVLNPNMSKDFPDVPENHWAYEAVSRLAGNGIVEGYEDGKYHGERQMTRYEMAEIIYNALSKGAKAEKKLVEEFRPELQAMAAQKKA